MESKENKSYYPAVSSNTLFHFTSKFEYLINILVNNFRPRYCMESLACLEPQSPLGLGPVLDYAIPLTCFCDIPLSLTSKHLATYGDYGIGLIKDWGMKRGLNPVLYIHYHSSLKNTINENIDIAKNISFEVPKHKLNQLTDVPINSKVLLANFDYLRFFTKPYEGPFYRNGQFLPEHVRFYDEREWRYVPKSDGSWKQFIYKEEFEDEVKRENYNSIVAADEKASLTFTPNDIKYIIVKEEAEILEIAGRIDNIKFKYNENERLLLKTRLISSEQIRADF